MVYWNSGEAISCFGLIGPDPEDKYEVREVAWQRIERMREVYNVTANSGGYRSLLEDGDADNLHSEKDICTIRWKAWYFVEVLKIVLNSMNLPGQT